MHFHLNSVEIFVPDGLPIEQALARTTHLSVAAHQDDLEIMAAGPILECFQQEDKWFTGVVVTDGRGSPRDDLYKNYTDEDMHVVRFKEQKKAAIVGEYAAQVMLDYPSKMIKESSNLQPVEDIMNLLKLARPQVVYTHNLADKHDTHVSVALRTIQALRALPEDKRPQQLLGCEVWRDVDWMTDADKVALNVSAHENLAAALVGLFDSQIAGGKRYDIATMGRRRANATYFASHGVDEAQLLIYAMDMTELLKDAKRDIAGYVQEYIDRFAKEVSERLKKHG